MEIVTEEKPIETLYRKRLAEARKAQGEKAFFDPEIRALYDKEPDQVLTEYRRRHPKGPVILYEEGTDRAAMVTKSTKEPGRWQVTWFDKRGFIGDMSHKTEHEAVHDAYVEGYRVPDPERGEKQMASREFLDGVMLNEKKQEEHRKWMAKKLDEKENNDGSNEKAA